MDEEEKKDAGTRSPDEAILKDCRDSLKIQIDEESIERTKMLDDLRFCTLDQWPADVRKDREDTTQEGGPRPCLTIDKINQFIVQVVNDMRQGKPGINVRPMDDDADVETAKIIKGIIRNIEDQSKADISYSTAGESAAKIGLGYIRVTTEYVSDDSFDQEIFIKPVPNTFSVYLGTHLMPDGSDTKKAWVIESVPVERFKKENPGKKFAPDDFSDLGGQLNYWCTDEAITVVEYFYIERKREELLFLSDGTTITKADYAKWPESAGPKPPVEDERITYIKQLKWCKMTGAEVLEKRDLPGKYIPIIEVVGRAALVLGKRVMWGLVRPAKDSLRMYNYFASALTEKMGLAPKTPWVAAEGQIAGREGDWKNSNRKNPAVLQYKPIEVNGNVLPAPVRQGAMPIESAIIQHMQVIEHDVQTSLGMFKAATGESESQQSGRAILALQKESDTGTYHFAANLGVSIRHVGVVILDMIPHYYDTKRIVRILGEDGTSQTVTIDPEQEMAKREIPQKDGSIQNIYNPGIGKYDIAITVGPSYATQRMEAQATFVEMAKGAADPASAAILRYLVMKNTDAAGGDEAAKLLKTMLPPQALQALDSKDPIPPKVQMMLAQMQQKMAQMQEAGAKLQEENVQLKAGAQVETLKVQTKAAADAEAHKLKIAEANDTHNLEVEKTRKAEERAIFEARLKAATAVTVAQIAAKGSLVETAIQAESDANIALSESLQPDGEMPEVAEPVSPIKKLTDMHAQGIEQSGHNMAQIGQMIAKVISAEGEATRAILVAVTKPKTITAKSSTGTTMTATVQ